MLTLSSAITTTHLTCLLSIVGHLVSLSFCPHILISELQVLSSFRSTHILHNIERWIQQWSRTHCGPWSLKNWAWIIFQRQLLGTAAKSPLNRDINFTHKFWLICSNLIMHNLKITSKKFHCSLQEAETHTFQWTTGVLGSSSRRLWHMQSTSVVMEEQEWDTIIRLIRSSRLCM